MRIPLAGDVCFGAAVAPQAGESSALEGATTEGESPVDSRSGCGASDCSVGESRCLGVQRQAGGGGLLRLQIPAGDR